MKAYLVTDSSHPHLVFQEVVTEDSITVNGYEYHIFPFYTVIQGFQWLSPAILTSFISANFVDPLDVHDAVLIRFLIFDRLAEYWSATKSNVVSMFSSMHKHTMEMINENNVNALLPSCLVSKIYPEDHPNKEWWNFKNDHDRI